MGNLINPLKINTTEDLFIYEIPKEYKPGINRVIVNGVDLKMWTIYPDNRLELPQDTVVITQEEGLEVYIND